MNDVYISKKMIEDGIITGVIIPFVDSGELKAQVGEYWFFIEDIDEREFKYTVQKEISSDVLVKKIKIVLDFFYEHPELFEDEYLYYYYYLCENI